MNVRELVALLEDEDQTMEVVIVSDYGDRSHTAQALEPDTVMAVRLKDSAYSTSGEAVDRSGSKKGRLVIAIGQRSVIEGDD